MISASRMWPAAAQRGPQSSKPQLLPPALRFRLWRNTAGAYVGNLQLPTGERFDIQAQVQADNQGRRWFEGTVRRRSETVLTLDDRQGDLLREHTA